MKKRSIQELIERDIARLTPEQIAWQILNPPGPGDRPPGKRPHIWHHKLGKNSGRPLFK